MRSRLHASTSLAVLWLGLACAATAPARTTASDFDARFAEVPRLYNDRDYFKLEVTLAALARQDAPRTIAAIKSLDRALQPRASEVVFGTWSRSDLRTAFAWARDNEPNFLNRMQFVRAVVAARDLSLLEEILIALGASQVPGAIQPEMSARDGRGMQSLLFVELAAREWAKADPQSIIAWARGATGRKFSGDIQANAFKGIVYVLAQKSPAETFQWLETGIFVDPKLDPPRNGPRGFYQAFTEGVILGSSVEAAEAYFRGKPPKRDYFMAYGALARGLAKIAPERIEPWIQAIDDPSFRGSAVPFVELRETQPQFAVELAIKYRYPTIPNPAGLMKQLREPLLAWAARDAAAALAFVEGAPNLTPTDRASLRASIAPNP